jgi:hypothetical protein
LLAFLGLKQAYFILTADECRLKSYDPVGFRRGWIGLLLVSFLWGLASIGLWNLSIRLFGMPGGMNVMSAMVLAAVILLFPMRLAAIFLCGLLGGKDTTARMLFMGVLVMVLTMCLLSLRPDWHASESPLPWVLGWLRPLSKSNRVLLLAPMWGAWSMLILPNFHRIDPDAFPQISAMAKGCGPLTATITMGVLLGWSGGYFAYLSWVQVCVSTTAVLVGVFGGLLLAYRNGQMDRKVLLATNLLTQLAVLVSFLGIRDIRVW